MRERRHRLILLAAGLAGVGAASAQSPSIYSLDVPVEVEYASNPQMAVGGSAATTWLRATPTFKAGYVRGNDRYDLDASVTAEKSSNTAVAQDRLDPRVRGAWSHEDPRNRTELALLLDRSALRTLDVREQLPQGVDGSRTLLAASGKWQHDVDERTTFAGEARQEWVRFSGSPDPDYRLTVASARLTRQRDERLSWYAAVDGQLYRAGSVPGAAAGGRPRSSVVGALAGMTMAVSEALRVDAAVGPVRFSGGSLRTDWQGVIKADYTGQRWSAGVDLARTPGVQSTLGGLVVTEEMRMRLRYELGDRTRLELAAGHAREKAARTERTLASAAWVRQLTPSWQVAFKGSVQRQAGPAGTARGTGVGVLLTYNAPDL